MEGPDELTVRAAGPDDAEAIEDVRRPSWRTAYAGLLPAAVIEEFTAPDTVRYQRENFAHPWRRALVAERGGHVVGFAAFGPERGAGRTPDRSVELYALYVHPDHWSAGVGWALLERVVTESRSAGREQVSLWVLESNDRARRFYERAGFTATGERQEQERLGNVPEIRYTRTIR